MPAWASLQAPSNPGTLHDWQVPVQEAAAQQIPSTQLPDAQVEAEAAVPPSPLPRLVTLYSQVSLLGPPPRLPPNMTATPRPMSKVKPGPLRRDGAVARVRTYHVDVFASSSQVS